MSRLRFLCSLFFSNDTATTEIYTLSLHDALPISRRRALVVGGDHLVPVPRARREHVRGRRGRRTPGHAERHRPRPGDRKSTRLNSSHSQISYAVFCLKKKKKKNNIIKYHHPIK